MFPAIREAVSRPAKAIQRPSITGVVFGEAYQAAASVAARQFQDHLRAARGPAPGRRVPDAMTVFISWASYAEPVDSYGGPCWSRNFKLTHYPYLRSELTTNTHNKNY